MVVRFESGSFSSMAESSDESTYSKSLGLLDDGQHPGLDVVGAPTLKYAIAKKRCTAIVLM